MVSHLQTLLPWTQRHCDVGNSTAAHPRAWSQRRRWERGTPQPTIHRAGSQQLPSRRQRKRMLAPGPRVQQHKVAQCQQGGHSLGRRRHKACALIAIFHGHMCRSWLNLHGTAVFTQEKKHKAQSSEMSLISLSALHGASDGENDGCWRHWHSPETPCMTCRTQHADGSEPDVVLWVRSAMSTCDGQWRCMLTMVNRELAAAMSSSTLRKKLASGGSQPSFHPSCNLGGSM